MGTDWEKEQWLGMFDDEKGGKTMIELKVKVEKDLENRVYITESGHPTRLDKELETEDFENELLEKIGELLNDCGCGYSLNIGKAVHSGEILK